VWSSAHEAAAGIARLALEMLVHPLAEITDPAEQWRAAEQLLAAHWKKFAMSPAKVASLAERIRSERAKLLGQPGLSIALTDDDRYILIVLDAHRGKAVTYSQIERESVRMNRDDPQKIKRLSDRTIRHRVPVLIERGFAERPPGTKKKGVAISDV